MTNYEKVKKRIDEALEVDEHGALNCIVYNYTINQFEFRPNTKEGLLILDFERPEAEELKTVFLAKKEQIRKAKEEEILKLL